MAVILNRHLLRARERISQRDYDIGYRAGMSVGFTKARLALDALRVTPPPKHPSPPGGGG